MSSTTNALILKDEQYSIFLVLKTAHLGLRVRVPVCPNISSY